MEKLTHKELTKQLDYNPLTGIFTRRNSNTNSIKIGDIAGSKRKDGYVRILLHNKPYYAQRLAWFYYYGYMPENYIDHIDRITHHNWISNLREITQICNSRNTGNPKNNTSGVKGVSLCKANKKWHSRIIINKKTKHLGYFKDFSEAVCNRLAAEQCLDWENCDSCSPAYQYVRENIQWWI